MVESHGFASASTSSHAREYRDYGFTILRSLLTPTEVDHMAASIAAYILEGGPLLRSYGLGNYGGWYCADFPREPSLRHMLTSVNQKRQLHAVLAQVRGATDFLKDCSC